MVVNYSHNVVIFLNSAFYTKSLTQVMKPLIANQSTVIYLFNIGNQEEVDLSLFQEMPNVKIEEITSQFVPPVLTEETLIIDALFGFENKQPLSGGFAAVARLINSSESTVISIGAPSGLLAEDNTNNNANQIVKADYTLIYGKAPLACYFDENQQFLGQWNVLPIGDSGVEHELFFVTEADVVEKLKPRKRFSHKGTYGHGLLIASSFGMAGSAILGAKAALKSGLGLLTAHVPLCNRTALQTTVPEAMVDADDNEFCFTQLIDTSFYQAVAVGPGLGMAEESIEAFKLLISQNAESKTPLVIDADGLNILANYSYLQDQIQGAILTPHIGEIERLIGNCNNSYIRLRKTIDFAKKTQTYIILKGAYSYLIHPDGSFKINSTGNEGLATAGSGDVLTGILLGLRTQGYSQEDAIMLGTYAHGLAADLAVEQTGTMSMTAQNIIDFLPLAWKSILEKAPSNGFKSFTQE